MLKNVFPCQGNWLNVRVPVFLIPSSKLGVVTLGPRSAKVQVAGCINARPFRGVQHCGRSGVRVPCDTELHLFFVGVHRTCSTSRLGAVPRQSIGFCVTPSITRHHLSSTVHCQCNDSSLLATSTSSKEGGCAQCGSHSLASPSVPCGSLDHAAPSPSARPKCWPHTVCHKFGCTLGPPT